MRKLTLLRVHVFLALCCAAGIAPGAGKLTGAPASQQQSGVDRTLPSAKEIVARYDEALGGREAILRHKSSTTRGTLEIHRENRVVTVPFVFYARAPYLRLEKFTLPGNGGESLHGFDGENAWSLDQHGNAQVVTGDERESVKRDADFYYPINELAWFKSMETVGTEDFEGRPCYRLHGINNWNKSNDHFYDRQTGLLAGYEFNSEWRGGPGLTRNVFSDYQKVDGVLVSMKQVVQVKPKSGGEWTVETVVTLTSVTFDDVDPGVLTPPQAVRDLLAKGNPTPKTEPD
ncbi:MAG: hypothetical protein LAO21_02895 [Acidobacteriia bacterium]|nr:hypothetical protein [Terriglobia bacterium]